MKQVLQAILSGSASPDDYANLALPDGYRGVTVHKDEVHMFDGFDSVRQGSATEPACRRGSRSRARTG